MKIQLKDMSLDELVAYRDKTMKRAVQWMKVSLIFACISVAAQIVGIVCRMCGVK